MSTPNDIELTVKTMEERKKEFMIGLEKLTRETGIIINGCGCCGSPSLDEASDAELHDPEAGYGYGYAGEVAWISRANNYDWTNFSDSIVRSSTLAQADAACGVVPGAMGLGR